MKRSGKPARRAWHKSTGNPLPATDDPRMMRVWRVRAEGRDPIPMATLAGCKTIAAKFPGFVTIEHETTGERWARNGPHQEWRQDRPGTPGHLR